MSRTSTVYLLHFDVPIQHAQHYLGSTAKLKKRLEEHRTGNGARLPQVFAQRGIGFVLVRTWKGNKQDERKLKQRHNGRKLCPICKREQICHPST